MIIRTLKEDETELLKEFLYEAIFIPEGVKPPDKSIIEKPELALYYEGFGTGDADNCLVKGLTVDILPGYWVSNQDVSYKAEDNHYNLRSLCRFVKLDEENKILHYIDMEDKPHEFHYDI